MKSFLTFIILTASLSSLAQTATEFRGWDARKQIKFLELHAQIIERKILIDRVLNLNTLLKTNIIKTSKYIDLLWGDTILEGPYATTGDATFETQALYFYRDVLFATKNFASAPGVFLEDQGCESDEETEKYTAQCSTVSIQEYFYTDSLGLLIESDDYPIAEAY